MRIVDTSEAVLINPEEEANTGDFLHGCFVSCIIYESGLALMAHYGPHPSFSEIHLRKIREFHEQVQQPVKQAFLCTRDQNSYYDMRMPLDDYERQRIAFKEGLEAIVGCEVECRTYKAGNVVKLTAKREVKVCGY